MKKILIELLFTSIFFFWRTYTCRIWYPQKFWKYALVNIENLLISWECAFCKISVWSSFKKQFRKKYFQTSDWCEYICVYSRLVRIHIWKNLSQIVLLIYPKKFHNLDQNSKSLCQFQFFLCMLLFCDVWCLCIIGC